VALIDISPNDACPITRSAIVSPVAAGNAATKKSAQITTISGAATK
jgi:hypothetical protein